MKKLFILASIVAISSLTPVFAQEGCPLDNMPPAPNCEQARPERPHCDFKKLDEQLKLTDEQKAKLDVFRKTQDEKIKSLMDKIRTLEESKKPICEEKLTVKERFDKFAPIDRQIEEAQVTIRLIREDGKEQFRSILTDKQIKKLDKIHKNKMKKHHGRKHGDFRPRPEMGGCPCPPPCHCPMPPREMK